MLKPIRYVIVAAVLAAAAPAAAQHPQSQLDDLRMQAEAAQRRAIDQQNQLMTLDARLRADQATVDLQRAAPRAPELMYEPSTNTPASTATPAYPQIPDSALADSNKRVQSVVRDRH